VYVEVRTNDRKTLLAEVQSGDASKEYKDYTDNTLELTVKAAGATKKDCEKFVFRVGHKPMGNCRWTFRGKVVLTFDDKTTLVQKIGDTKLDGKSGMLVWTDLVKGKDK
jgi:hypothetical protein